MSEVRNIIATAAANQPPVSTPDMKSSFWYDTVLGENRPLSHFDAGDWNHAKPYQLMVVSAPSNGGNGYALASGWTPFTLPIAPEALSISTPPAINTLATLGGIVEEHNAAPFKYINLQGTTGVNPNRGLALSPLSGGLATALSTVGSFFGGTVQAAQNLVNTFRAQLTGKISEPALVPDPTNNTDLAQPDVNFEYLKNVGLHQWSVLEKYIERYLNIKKTAAGKNLRLVFASWKEQTFYIVTPTEFELNRNAASPYEYPFKLQFKAWRRIPQVGTLSISQAKDTTDITQPDLFQIIKNWIEFANRVLNEVHDVIANVMFDIADDITEVAREVGLLVQNAINGAADLMQMPARLISDVGTEIAAQGAGIKDALNNISDVADNMSFNLSYAVAHTGADIYQAFTNDALSRVVSSSSNGNGFGSSSSPLTSTTSKPSSTALSKILSQPHKGYQFFKALKTSNLRLSTELQRKIQVEKDRVNNLTKNDLRDRRDKVSNAVSKFCARTGLSSPTYNNIYNVTDAQTVENVTQEHYDAIYAMVALGNVIDKLIANKTTAPGGKLNSLNYVAGLARQSGIAFNVPVSKFAVPFPYGHTLERLAKDHLDDPNRWMEIVTLNGLRAPYIDEEGFEVPLISNGKGNTVVVSGADNLYVNQSVTVYSATVAPTQRNIMRIDPVGTSAYIITLDGDSDMDQYKIVQRAVLHTFLPDTVNSQQIIYIPSNKPAPNTELFTNAIPSTQVYDSLLDAGGTDIMLDQSGDIVLTNDGDCKLAVGLQNIIQRVRLAAGTPKGSLLHHPEFGMAIPAGKSTADVSVKDLMNTASNIFGNDPLLSVSKVAASKKGPTVLLSFAVQVRGMKTPIPVSVDVAR